ncbi:ABC transporter permease [Ectothiorhodospira sp. BSL-9]|uniref:ABC transporter permease n=1 Tax=Ectothiorhodospira sp. BSL-9 TaxID=1442136 RepID=UPI0007B4359B|nr:ABC transporter permease [Ectothiorhodospira sp. BSL-9]ANB01148.1 ABC transporter permease [Ectothiorhodospira sp. BSL-9]TVQ74728.1 MAG: ABC transporter permease [Chromatiaceae bacterium]
MLTYILRRLLLMIPTLVGITIVVFVVMAAAPGGISAQSLVDGMNLEPQAKQAMEDYYNRMYGLDQPPPVQYLRWVNNISPAGFTFDRDGAIEGFSFWKGSELGTSFRYGRPVGDLIAERLPITLLLNVLSIPIIYIIAIAVGVQAATRRGGSFDTGSGVVLLGLWSVPTMLAGVLLIGFFASEQFWRWFPTGGINRREALDMTFLPHWGTATDLLMLFLLAGLGAALMVWLALRAAQRWRVLVGSTTGAALGFLMAAQVSDQAFGLLHLLLMVTVGGSLALAAGNAFVALRVGLLGLVGMAIGIALAAGLAQGEFVRGFLFDRLWHLILPVLCLAYGGFAFLAKLTRSAVLENLLSDYARTARAKGVSERDVLWRHVFRNSLLPLITVSATLLPSLLAGSVIVETIFSIDGMGKLAVEAVQTRDRELVLSVTLISGMLTLAGYLIADLCYAIADPRVSYD